MSEDYIIQHCAPTLAGIKTGSIFTCPCESKEALLAAVRRMNTRLGHKGLRVLPLRFSEKSADLSVPSKKAVQRSCRFHGYATFAASRVQYDQLRALCRAAGAQIAAGYTLDDQLICRRGLYVHFRLHQTAGICLLPFDRQVSS